MNIYLYSIKKYTIDRQVPFYELYEVLMLPLKWVRIGK